MQFVCEMSYLDHEVSSHIDPFKFANVQCQFYVITILFSYLPSYEIVFSIKKKKIWYFNGTCF